MNDKIIKSGLAATFGVLSYLLFMLYWTFRNGSYLIREPNLFILIFEILMIIFLMVIQIYAARNFKSNATR